MHSKNIENIIKETLKEAGETLMHHFGTASILEVKDAKNPHSIVTEADLAAEKAIIRNIKKYFPEDHIVSEEAGEDQSKSETVWYIAPLDGTRNFESQTPMFGVSIGRAQNNIMTHGGIYLPVTTELFYAEKDKGAQLNEKRIHCSNKETFEGSYGISVVKPGRDQSVIFLKEIHQISNGTAWVNSLGCVVCAAAWTAAGRRDWYITPNPDIWDIAASALILKESGCLTTARDGSEWMPGKKGFVTANKHLHPKLLETVQSSFGIK